MCYAKSGLSKVYSTWAFSWRISSAIFFYNVDGIWETVNRHLVTSTQLIVAFRQETCNVWCIAVMTTIRSHVLICLLLAWCANTVWPSDSVTYSDIVDFDTLMLHSAHIDYKDFIHSTLEACAICSNWF